MLTGALLVDKPAGLTSHDVVSRARRLARQRRCGHTGTLDPFATGLLVLCLGRATRLARFLSELPKSYLATVRFGFATDTYDRTGRAEGEPTEICPGPDELEAALAGFLGPQKQRPPVFSAKRVGGKRSHRMARAGVPFRPEAVEVEVQELRLLSLTPPRARLEATVSSGTYIRSLAHDLGRRLGTGAHLEELRRIRVGSFRVEEASTLDDLEKLSSSADLDELLLSPSEMLRDLPPATLSAEEEVLFGHGRDVPREEAPSRTFRVEGRREGFLGVGRSDERGRVLRPLVVFSGRDEEEAQGQ
jgi:tRNA pseudouridine55 synthase